MTSTRVMRGMLYNGGQELAFLSTNQPYGIVECNEIMRRAKLFSDPRVGNLTIQLGEGPECPGLQDFTVFTDRTKKIKRRDLEALVKKLFPSCEFRLSWVNEPATRDGRRI